VDPGDLGGRVKVALGVLWVLDPAIDASKALSVSEWVSAASRTSPSGTSLTIHIADPRSWNFVYETQSSSAHVEPPRTDVGSYCKTVDAARGNLASFARRSPRRVTVLRHVKVKQIDPRGFVVFSGKRRTYGPFAIDREDLARELRSALARDVHVTVKRQRLYTSSRLGNFWRFLTGGLEGVFEVTEEKERGRDDSESSPPSQTPAAMTSVP
jgi:hypothetical protein